MEIQDGSAKFKAEFNPIMPNGSIITFSGSFTEEGYPIDNQTGVVYTNWHVCNGEEGTVDLRGKFILGSSDTHEVGEVGGEETHTLTIEEMPEHEHSVAVDVTSITGSIMMHNAGVATNIYALSGSFYPAATVDKYQTPPPALAGAPSIGTIGLNATHAHTATANANGGSQPHNNMPPYYALAYMQKI